MHHGLRCSEAGEARPDGSTEPARRRRPRCCRRPGARSGGRGSHETLGVAPCDFPPGGNHLEYAGVVGGARQVGVVDRRVEAARDLCIQVVSDAVQEHVDAVVIGLAARPVGFHEPDAGEDERQVALDVGIDAQREVAGRGHRVAVGGSEGDRPGRWDVGGAPPAPGVIGVEVEAGEDGVLVVDERGVLEERRIPDRAPVFLGCAKVGEREDAGVITDWAAVEGRCISRMTASTQWVRPAAQSFALEGVNSVVRPGSVATSRYTAGRPRGLHRLT